ncbi:MAG TPA: gluconate 2-dehydrogenase subunit 3 family protein [Terriglobales bacterium]|nr:gluconate 2-dehydrogenase subunit 3 family protein [Terriglobales bacterium]
MQKTSDDAQPIDPHTGEALAPTPQPGYYPGFHTMSQKAFWDEATRTLVVSRMEDVPPIRFFTAEEAKLMAAVCDRILPQDDRDEQHRIPIVNVIDERLYENRLDGYRYTDMPPDQEAHRMGLQAIEEIAEHMFGKSFLDLSAGEQELILETLHDGNPPAAHDIWKRMDVERFWLLLVQDVVGAYYAHPYAWDEIGFGGPAYPRGYMRLEHGDPEPWEMEERRYEWAPPQGSPSAKFTKVGGKEEHKASPGQGGTH